MATDAQVLRCSRKQSIAILRQKEAEDGGNAVDKSGNKR
jgi:hypothetical protein